MYDFDDPTDPAPLYDPEPEAPPPPPPVSPIDPEDERVALSI